VFRTEGCYRAGEVNMKSEVESRALEASGQRLVYAPTEKMGAIVVDGFPGLGRLAAMRFIEWVQQNPAGVISLPTGRTPEHFIKWVVKLLTGWGRGDIPRELEAAGIDPAYKPDLAGLHFVQIDEFYPISPRQHNSFFSYVDRLYLDGFGLDRSKALLINCAEIGLPGGRSLDDVWPGGRVDLSLRYRQATTALESLQKTVIENIDQWALEREDRIRALGGIGFFLGGIGPDGHIGFNVQGSDHHSTTRLAQTNYETQAAAATDLGGLEVSRNRLVITIGLSTITYNPDCTAIIMAAGEAKAAVVADAIQRAKHVRHPATVLHGLPNARFYLTSSAANGLVERRYESLRAAESVPARESERIVLDLAARKGKRLDDLVGDDFCERGPSLLLQKCCARPETLTGRVRRRLIECLERGLSLRTRTTFLHTEPHHDDLMLGCLPSIVRHLRDASNRHHFACLTSGFTSVTNHHMLGLLDQLNGGLAKGEFDALIEEGYFDPGNTIGRSRDVWQYLDGVAAGRSDWQNEGVSRRVLRNLMQIFDERDVAQLRERVEELYNYFSTQYPGKKDLPYVQQLKGMTREWEAECLWGYFGADTGSVHHLRLGFYQGDLFTEEPTVDRDVQPVLALLREVNPDVVNVAFDPEASGPDTHYKVLQTIAEALRLWERDSRRSDIEVWCYRNVWCRFHPSEVDVIVPVSLNMFALQHNAFMNAFVSQRDASFPCHEHDGPFSELAQKIQVRQYGMLKVCLGREFFNEHPSPMVRATRGLVFMRRLSLAEFYEQCRELRRGIENS